VTANAAHRLLEQPFFFDLSGEKLFAMLHLPAAHRLGTVVLCHAFAEEKLWSHRVYVTFARELAAAGYAVLRFDMRGEGDSDREFEQSDIDTRVADTRRAVDVACERTGDRAVTLVGHRLGGSIAAAAAGELGDRVRGVIAWDPVLDGADYFGGLLRSNMATQMATAGKVTRTRDALIAAMLAGEVVVADGYGLAAPMYRGICTLQWSTRADFFRRPMLALEVPKGEQTAPSAVLTGLLCPHPGASVQLAAEPPFWRETRQFHRRAGNFTAATLEWLRLQGTPA
jgi:uncharacterized protein